VHTDYILEVYRVYRVETPILRTLLSSLILTNTRFLFYSKTWILREVTVLLQVYIIEKVSY